MTTRLLGAAVTASLLVGAGAAALAQVSEPQTPPISVDVDCYSSPERVTITNDRTKALTVQRIGSTYNRRSGEPYRVKKKLKPGRSVTYTFGTGKGGKRLSGSFIFDNEAAREGVLVKTNKGNVRVRCAVGTNVPEAPEPELTDTSPVEPAGDGEPVDALELLATLRVEPEVDEGYERALFEHWLDADADGCDTRAEVLIAESSTPAVVGDGCTVESGTWYSAPDGDTLTNPASIDINHVVPLKEAWASGAYAWSPERRAAFANDLDDERTLQAVSAGANRQQGEADPASWLPLDREAACRFVTDWVAIKASWDLAVDETERDAIAFTLENCAQRTTTVTRRSTEGLAAVE